MKILRKNNFGNNGFNSEKANYLIFLYKGKIIQMEALCCLKHKTITRTGIKN